MRIYWGLLALPVLGIAFLLVFGRSDLQQVRVAASAAIAPAESAYRAIQPRLVAVGRLDTVLPRLEEALPRIVQVVPRLEAIALEARTATQLLARQDDLVRRLQGDLATESQQLTTLSTAVAALPRVDVSNLATAEQVRGLREQFSRIEQQQQALAAATTRLNAALETIQGLQGSSRRLEGRIDSIVRAGARPNPRTAVPPPPERR